MTYLGATADLLKVAHGTLREQVVAQLHSEGRFQAAMVANAMAIAIRELELGAKTRAEERDLLAGFYGVADGTLAKLRSRLCRDLRSGSQPGSRAAELEALLDRLVQARLAISNPDYRW